MIPPGVTVRPATAADAALLAELRWAFRAEVGDVVESRDAFTARCTAWMRGALGPGGRWQAWIAERTGTAIGNSWLQLVEKIPNPVVESEWHGYISNVYVAPEARGHGVGKALLDAALEHCRTVQPYAVILWPTERSRSLYVRAGFSPPTEILSLQGSKLSG